MLEFDFDALAALGLSPELAARASALDLQCRAAAQMHLTRVVEVHRDGVALHDARVARVALPLPRARCDRGLALAVGDWVVVEVDRHGDLWVTQRVPPSSAIARRDADGRRHPVVSNVDVALLVMGLDDDFNARRIERFLALVSDEAIAPVVVLTKADVVSDAVAAERQALLRARLPSRVAILAVNALSTASATALQPFLAPGRTLVMLGSSGAGKSTLTNTLLGAAIQDTGAVRQHDSRGKHTTTSRSLHRLPGGACVIDTPGVRTLRPDGGEATLAGAFPDVDALAAQCRFHDCRHMAEPGCAVREGIDADRLRNYHKLGRELRRDSQSALERRQQVATWKARGREARVRLRAKRGANDA